MTDFFKHIFQHTPQPGSQYVSWGSVASPIFLSVQQVIEGVGVVSDHTDLFFSPAPRTEGGMKKVDVAGSSVAWVELDYYKLPRYIFSLLPPSYIVSSGKGHHLYWLLDRFYKGPDVERANRVLAQHVRMVGEFCGNINRVLRVPHSFNFKYPAEGPLPVDIIEERPERTYPLADLLRLQLYEPELLEVPEGLSRSERDYRLAAKLVSWGITRPSVQESLMTYSEKAQERQEEHDNRGGEGTVDYVRRTLDKVFVDQASDLSTKPPKEKGTPGPLANVDFTSIAFLLRPDGTEAGLALRLTWDEDKSVMASAQADDFSSRSRVISWLKKYTGTRTFFASDAKALQLWGDLVATCPQNYQWQVAHAGRYDMKGDKRLFVTGPSTALTFPDNGGNDVFWQPDIEVRSTMDLGDEEDRISIPEMATILRLLLASQRPEVVVPALGWVAATPFKSLIEEIGARVPTLLLYGVRGSGKTSFIQHALMPFLGVQSQPISADITMFALVGHLALTKSWPVWVGEYRASNRNAQEFQQILRSSYDGGSVERGRPNQSVVSYLLTAPVVVDGETTFSDPANVDRTISLRLLSGDVAPDTTYADAFLKLKTWTHLRGPMARHYLNWTLTRGKGYVQGLYSDGLAIMGDHLRTSRASNNFAVAWAGLKMLQGFVDTYGLGIEVPSDPLILVEAARNTHFDGLGTQTYVDMLASQVSHFWQLPDLQAEYEVDTDTLWFNLTRATHALRLPVDVNMLTLQLQERVGVYIVGPARRTGGATYWGIEIKKAQDLGLDVFQPYQARFVRATVKSNGASSVLQREDKSNGQ